MQKTDLHDILQNLLSIAEKPLSVRELTNLIHTQKLWHRPSDGHLPGSNQIHARINKYPHLFKTTDGKVTLKSAGTESVELFTRLTYNENDWIVPSGHLWKKSNQGKKGIKFENQFGFGHEEWLLNTRYNIKGYQYGYIRGLRRYNKSGLINKVHLYSIKAEEERPQIKTVFYIGFISAVELLDADWRKKLPEVAKVYDEYEEICKQEIQKVGGDIKSLGMDEFIAVVRFRLENAELNTTHPVIIDNFPFQKFTRFQPYEMTPSLRELFTRKPDTGNYEDEVVFAPGKASQKQRHQRIITASEKAVIKQHCIIVDAVEKYLKPEYSLKKGNISIEKTYFRGNIADIVTIEADKSITIYEIKTNAAARKNIRDAIGQLLDYASHAGQQKVIKLVIVSPAQLSGKDEHFLKVLQKTIRFSLEYWWYNTEKNHIVNLAS